MNARDLVLDCFVARRIAACAVMGRSLLASTALLAVVSAASTGSASAAIVTATYTGTVRSGFDQRGIFGTANGNLKGDSFTVVYTINDAVPGTHANSNPPYYTGIYGGSAYGSGSTSPVSAVVWINGHSFSIAGRYSGQAYQSASSSGLGEVDESVLDVTSHPNTQANVYNTIWSYNDHFVPSFDYHTPLFHQVQSYDSTNSGLSIYDPKAGIDTSATLSDSSVTISGAISAVPELSTWAMTIIGFAGVALQLRRREVASLTA